MSTEDSNILSARINALTIVLTQTLSLYAMNAKDPAGLTKEMKEAAESILSRMRPEIQEEGKKTLDWIYTEVRRAAQQSD